MEKVESTKPTSDSSNLFQIPGPDAAKKGEGSKFTYDPGSFGERWFSNILREPKMEFATLDEGSATMRFQDKIPKLEDAAKKGESSKFTYDLGSFGDAAKKGESSKFTYDLGSFGEFAMLDEGSATMRFQDKIPKLEDAAKKGESSKFTYDLGSFGEFAMLDEGSATMRFQDKIPKLEDAAKKGESSKFTYDLGSFGVAEPEVQRKKWSKVVFLPADIGKHCGFPLCDIQDLNILDEYREEAKKNVETEKSKNAV